MSKKNIPQLHRIEEVNENPEMFTHQNAFIRKDGSFYLAKGYTGCNPYQQVESSALWIGRYDIGMDFEERFRSHYERLMRDGESPMYIKQLRTILVQYYGYALFCRCEIIKSFKDRDIFCDCSLVPDEAWYGQKVTSEQISVLRTFIEINEDGTLIRPKKLILPSYQTEVCDTSDKVLSLILEHGNNRGYWHH